MKSKIIEKLKAEGRKAFLKLDPVARIFRMEAVLYEAISIKAREEGRLQGEIYRRYLGRDKKRRRGI